MEFENTPIPGAFLIRLQMHSDERGSFTRLFDPRAFKEQGLNPHVEQVAISRNTQARTLRGMHMQAPPFAEAKIVHCSRGRLFDVIVDLRDESPTFCQWFGRELSGAEMLYVPEGCAHGFLTLEPHTEVLYHITQIHSPECERGYLWDDPAFGIEWPETPRVISARDRAHPPFQPDFSASSSILSRSLAR